MLWYVNQIIVYSRTPLMYASLIGLKDTVSTLLQHGANPLLRDTNGHQGIF
jgi:ankyrin repeat protein